MNPPFVATDEQRETIARMASHGMNLDMIATALGVSEKTLREKPDLVSLYNKEFAKTVDEVCDALLTRAKRADDTSLMIFVAKTRAKWRSDAYLPPCRLKGKTFQEKKEEITGLLEDGRLGIDNYHKLMDSITKEFQIDEQIQEIQELKKFKEHFEQMIPPNLRGK